MISGYMRWGWRVCFTFMFWMGVAQAGIKVITLDYLDASDAVEVLAPMMKPGESISGVADQLVLDAGSATQARVRTVLASLDAAPDNLRVDVRRGRSTVTYVEAAEAGLRGSNSGVSVRGKMDSRTLDTDSKGDWGTYVLSGERAFIETGAAPVRLGGGYVSGRYGRSGRITREAELGRRGIWVAPRVRGDKVTVKVSAELVRGLSGMDQPEGVSFSTVLKGRVGTWLSLANESRQSSTLSKGLLGTRSLRATDDESYEIRVTRPGR